MNSQNPSKSLIVSEDGSKTSEIPNPQVKEKQSSPRRSFNTAYKIRILAEYDACSNQLAHGELLRKEGRIHQEFLPGKRSESLGNLGGNIKMNPIKK